MNTRQLNEWVLKNVLKAKKEISRPFSPSKKIINVYWDIPGYGSRLGAQAWPTNANESTVLVIEEICKKLGVMPNIGRMTGNAYYWRHPNKWIVYQPIQYAKSYAEAVTMLAYQLWNTSFEKRIKSSEFKIIPNLINGTSGRCAYTGAPVRDHALPLPKPTRLRKMGFDNLLIVDMQKGVRSKPGLFSRPDRTLIKKESRVSIAKNEVEVLRSRSTKTQRNRARDVRQSKHSS